MGRRQAEPSQHRPHLHARRSGRPQVHRHGVRPGHQPARVSRSQGRARTASGPLHHEANRPGRGRRRRGGIDPPRHQARKPAPDPQGPGQGRGLRALPHPRCRQASSHPTRRGSRNPHVHEPRAGPGPCARPPERPLLDGRDLLPHARRLSALLGRFSRRPGPQARPRQAHQPRRAPARPPQTSGRPGDEADRQGPQGPLLLRVRHASRPRPDPRPDSEPGHAPGPGHRGIHHHVRNGHRECDEGTQVPGNAVVPVPHAPASDRAGRDGGADPPVRGGRGRLGLVRPSSQPAL